MKFDIDSDDAFPFLMIVILSALAMIIYQGWLTSAIIYTLVMLLIYAYTYKINKTK